MENRARETEREKDLKKPLTRIVEAWLLLRWGYQMHEWEALRFQLDPRASNTEIDDAAAAILKRRRCDGMEKVALERKCHNPGPKLGLPRPNSESRTPYLLP